MGKSAGLIENIKRSYPFFEGFHLCFASHKLNCYLKEIYGEDPFLSGWLTTAYVKGLQGHHPKYIRANAGCKTLAAHSGPENIPSLRFSFDAKVCTIPVIILSLYNQIFKEGELCFFRLVNEISDSLICHIGRPALMLGV